eukprot:bmy_07000T0
MHTHTDRKRENLTLDLSHVKPMAIALPPGFPSIFIIGENSKQWISLHQRKSTCLNIAEDRDKDY